ncbi:MAG: DUF1801 domain-containing protein [Lactobacillales bacterium]|jgi:uncharacterized protein YdhG (YjbR/CyaY superfamily)|nr:DUF1801 domain-containing protein [Lactobacillales bacterium]
MGYINTLDEWLDTVAEENRDKAHSLVNWAQKEFPQLELRMAWNKPMLTDHGTHIISFAAATNWISLMPEEKTMLKFEQKLRDAGYAPTKKMFRIKWNETPNYELLKEIIEFNIEDKKDEKNFWR